MELDHEHRDGALVITPIDPRIDAAVAIHFKDRMRALTQDVEGCVLLDLHRVDFVDSSGLGAIVGAMKQLGTQARLELAGLTPNVAKVFRLTRMDTVFTIHDSVEQVAAAAANHG